MKKEFDNKKHPSWFWRFGKSRTIVNQIKPKWTNPVVVV